MLWLLYSVILPNSIAKDEENRKNKLINVQTLCDIQWISVFVNTINSVRNRQEVATLKLNMCDLQ